MSHTVSQPTLPSSEGPIAMSSLAITENAANKIGELIRDEGNLQLKLRVFITGGGCSGFQYGFSFDETINEDDTIITKAIVQKSVEASEPAQVQLLVDPMSLTYLIGAEIDYKSDLTGEQFIIRNPNAKTTCGCGSSFSA